MKTKIIDLIKKFRAESERHWGPTIGYKDAYARGYSIACGHCADDLEELLEKEEK